MAKTHIYGVNNYSGVSIEGLKDSVYDIKTLYKEDLEIIEENQDLIETSNSLINLEKVSDLNTKVFNYANKLITDDFVPICFAGDHSVAIGSISATSKSYENLGIVWIDAHADINTEQTSPTGNIHGMPLSFLLGYGCDKLSKIGDWSPKIKACNIIYLGLRSVDDGEKEIIKNLGIKAYYYDEICEKGLDIVLNESLAKFNNINNIHISFDFDSMDPDVFSAVSTPVAKGFNKENVFNIFDSFIKTNKVKAIDLVEYNRTRDTEANSLNFALKLLDFIQNIA